MEETGKKTTCNLNMVGHEVAKRQLAIAMLSANTRNVALPHMLFSGSPGCGKTTMAKELASTWETDFISIMPENLKDLNSLKKLIESLNHVGYDKQGNKIKKIKPSIVFIDEIHRLPMYGQEKLGIIMENLLMETGRPNRFYWVPHFTVVGATTQSGELSKPFLDRFKLNIVFQPYSKKESIDIILMHAKELKIGVTYPAAEDIASRGRGIPRILVGYLECCRDVALAFNSIAVTTKITKTTFKDLNVDEQGFTLTELKILKLLYKNDRPIGLDTLSVATNESPKTIKNEIEPYLIQNGLLIRSGSGRLITLAGKEYIEEKTRADFEKVEIEAQNIKSRIL